MIAGGGAASYAGRPSSTSGDRSRGGRPVLRKLAAAAAAFALALFACTSAPAAAPQEIGPSDEHIHFEGRVDWTDPQEPTMSFPGCALVVHFDGTGFDARMSTTIADHLQVEIDGQPTSVLALSKNPEYYPVARDLSPGDHTVALYKGTETNRGTLQFFGLRLQPGTTLLSVPAAARRIEFIGDSITCGYGDMAAGKNEPVSPANSNWYYTFGAITARTLGAEQVTVAVSGIRLTPSGDWPAMPTVYRRIHSYDGGRPWDFTKGPVPDVVVVDLATNDFRAGGPDEQTWVNTYLEFIDFIRARRPRAQIYLADGPMMPPGADLDHVRAWNREVVARRKAAGDDRCRAFTFAVQREEDGYGSDWHPSVKTHARMAGELVAAIKSDTGW